MKDKAIVALAILGIIAWILISIVAFIIETLSSFIDTIVYFKKPISIVFIACIGIFLAYKIFSFYYFKSNKFKSIKDSIKKHTTNCNNLNHYIQELQELKKRPLHLLQV